MRPATNIRHRHQRQQGFTLLELLLVVTILASVAWMAMGLVENKSDQIRFEDTRNRLAAIRRAVVGDTSRTLNGQPVISGYVADMGVLPPNLNALIVEDYCSTNPALNAGACGAGWVDQPAYGYNATYGLWMGWNGPYLTAAELVGYPKLRDGWGYDDGTNNFGWNVTVGDDLSVQSLGRDGAPGGTDDYENDYPPAGSNVLVGKNGWRVLITDSGAAPANDESGGLTIHFGAPPSCWRCSDNTHNTREACEAAGDNWYADAAIADSAVCTAPAPGGANGQWQPDENLCLRIAYRVGNAIAERVSSGNNGNHLLTWDSTSKSALFAFEDTTAPHDEDFYLPLGQAAFRAFEYDTSGSCTTNEYPRGSAWKTFAILPGAVILPLEWKVE